MLIGDIQTMLLWCVVINYAILFVWFGVFIFAHDWMYDVHSRWFMLPVETFDAIHYAGMTIYKIGIMLLFLVPLITLLCFSSGVIGARP